PRASQSALKSLLVDGMIGGVGSVVSFLPNIMFLFLAIAILEDSGYMARAAFIMDRVMHKVGLHGKSFIPMLIGFGCSVPAIMATRTLENRTDRLTTVLVIPLISCGARLTIYLLIIPAFFPLAWRAPLLWIMYLTGILLAMLAARLIRSTLLKGEATPFVMELPPYRMPTFRGAVIHMWERAWLFLRKAGTIILGISIVLWALTTYPKKENLDSDDNEKIAQERIAYSAAGRIGRALEPVLAPLGFDWRIGTALIGAFAAKEVFVAQMGIVYAVGEAGETSKTLSEKLRENYTPLTAFCIMLFCLVSAPCIATIVVTKREAGLWRWSLLQLAGLTALAYILTLLVYQIGSLLS
ncbi:ferrous iron transport protein B, partial [bacterium]|nr:ferrous iron transport protein B [bacterium]